MAGLRVQCPAARGSPGSSRPLLLHSASSAKKKKMLLAISLALRPELISPPSWPLFVPLTEGTPIQDLERSPGFLLQGPPGAVGEPGLPGEPGLKVRPDERRETGLVETSSQLTVKSWLQRNGPFLCWDNEFYVFLVQGVGPTRASTPPHPTAWQCYPWHQHQASRGGGDSPCTSHLSTMSLITY